MVPQSASPPPPEPRRLHPETESALRAVIAEEWRAAAGSQEALAGVVARVAREARDDGLRPEELIIILKQVETQVLGAPGTLRAGDLDARRRFREWLVSSCVRAYFAE